MILFYLLFEINLILLIKFQSMRIVAKEIDRYESKRHKNKNISEYIIYLMVDNIPIEAYIEFGLSNRDARITQLNINNLETINYYLIN